MIWGDEKRDGVFSSNKGTRAFACVLSVKRHRSNGCHVLFFLLLNGPGDHCFKTVETGH